jgi:hypothetical protein
MGYFKSIHNVVFELLKLIDIYSLNSIANLIFNNILFANLNDGYNNNYNFDVINLLDIIYMLFIFIFLNFL